MARMKATAARRTFAPPSLRAAALAALALALALAPSAEAREWRSWCGEGLGWHFYCDRADDAGEDAPPPPPEAAPKAAPEAAADRVLALRRALGEARAAAVLDPTPDNVTAYLRLQRDALQRAATFSDAFRRAVWADPALDYTQRRPVGALAKQLWSEERRAARRAALARLGERYGLIYLGRPDCSGCRVQGPLLRAFAVRHGLDVLAVSMTGGPLEGWPEAVPDDGRAARLGLGGERLPAIVLFDTHTDRAIPVAFGVVAEDQLAERIFTLTAREVGDDY